MHSDLKATRHLTRRRTGVIGLVVAVLLGGCGQRTRLDDSAVDLHGTYDAELDFWDEIATRHVITNDDALHGLLLLATEQAMTDYDERLREAKRKGWINDKRFPPATESARVGLISMAVCDILDLEGGLTMRLLGPSPRYCTRELVYLEIIPRRSENQSLSGLEFTDLVGRVEDRMGGGPSS